MVWKWIPKRRWCPEPHIAGLGRARRAAVGMDGGGDGERGHSRGRFDDEHPRLLSFLTFGLDGRVRLGIVEG